MSVEIKRPGSDAWESSADLGGSVSLGDVVGSLVRYPSGIVFRIAGITEPDANGNRQLLPELYDPSERA